MENNYLVDVLRPDGSCGKTVFLEDRFFFDRHKGRSRFFTQFNIDNSSNGSLGYDLLLRIGSVFGHNVSGVYPDTPNTALFDFNIRDDFGSNVKQCQMFSMLSCGKGIIVSKAMMQSNSMLQKSVGWKYKQILPDFTTQEISINTFATQEKTDRNVNITIICPERPWVIDSNTFLEIPVKPGATFQLCLFITGYANSVEYVSLK